MAAKVKVEWVKLALAGSVPNPDIIAEVVGEPQLLEDIAAVPVLTDPAPAWPDESRQRVETGFARIYVLEGAVLADWGAEEDLDPAAGALIAANPRPTYVSIRRGHAIAFIESAEVPPSGGGGGGEFSSEGIGQPGDAVAAADTGEFNLIQMFQRLLQRSAQLVTAATDTSDVNVKGPPSAIVAAVPATSANNYTTGQVIGTLMTFAGLTRGAGLASMIQTAMIQSKVAIASAVELIVFHTNPAASAFVDHTALALNAADFDKTAARILFSASDWTSLGVASLAEVSQQGRLIKTSGADAYAVLVARGNVTLASATDLKVVFKTIPD